MLVNNSLLIGKTNSGGSIYIHPEMLNRHGLISGATGTGKTVTIQVLAETLSEYGIPCFVTDIKGDFSGVSVLGGENKKVHERITELNLTSFKNQSFPVCFWDVFGKKGHPLRTTISEMGPVLLGRLLNLNDIQSSVLSIVFKIADDSGLLLLDLKDLQKMLEYVSTNRSSLSREYGNISVASIGAIQRSVILIEQQGAEMFYGEPAINLYDFIQTDQGKGIINILSADELMLSPKLYSAFLLWLMSEMYESLPEVGDVNKPKMVLFFDEAHLIFKDAPKVLLDKIEQVIRLIRSKGIGVFFISQSPLDVPDTILSQLGNRIQHALRAFTPADQKMLKAVAQTFRPNPEIDVLKSIGELGVGEALVSFLDGKAMPSIVQRVKIVPPQAKIGGVNNTERDSLIKSSLVYGAYEEVIDRESAFEILTAKIQKQVQEDQTVQPSNAKQKIAQDFMSYAYKSASRQIGNEIGRQLVRGLLGSFLGTSKRRRR